MCCLFQTYHLPRALSLLTALAALWLCLLSPHAARAGAYTYDTSARRTVNAGILLLDSTDEGGGKGDSNKDPYLFYILNQRIDIRPFGWNIVNPLAPATVTQAIQARWYARANGNQVYGLGQTVTPNMAPYWEVDLQRTAADDLSQFDVLFLGIDTGRQATFSVTDVQKLLHFVDNGGILYIEYVGNNIGGTLPIDPLRGLFFGLQFHGTTIGNGGAVPGTVGSLPLLSTPYNLSAYELNTLGDKGIGNYYIDDGNGNLPGSGLLSNVINNATQSNKPLVAAGSLGAGGIIVSALGVANAINERIQTANNIEGPSGYNSGPYCGTNFLAAPTADLKFLSNVLAAVGTHPNAHQNSHNTGFTPNGLPSAARTWTTSGTPGNGGGNSPAVINGNYVYVTTGNTLRAYDLYPAEDLDGNGNPDDGDLDYSQGKPYDQVWHANVGDYASAPTVAVEPLSGTVLVFVERADGTVEAYNGATGGAFANSPLKNSGTNRGNYSTPAPAPTYYNGKIYAGGQDGSLYVYNLQTSVDAKITVDAGSPASPVVAPPTVGTVLDAGVNDIVALVTTTNGMYSVFCGARGETLKGSGSTFNTKLQPLASARMDINPSTWKVYTIPTPSDGYPAIIPPANVTPGAAAPNFTLNPVITQALLGNYDVDFNASAAVSPSALTRTIVSLTSGPITPGGNLSAPALDRYGYAYYTAGNSLFCVHDSATLPQIKWRFRLPTAPMLDADGTNYTPLVGYHFVGAPVVDEQGLVYVLASNGSSAVVLCFNGQLGVSADAPGAGTDISISQLDPSNATVNEFGQTAPSNINGGQFSINSDGHITFSNFAPNNGSGGVKTLSPNLNEPFPIQIQINVPKNQTPPPPFQLGLHTNLVYYSGTANYPPSSGLTKVGSSLFYTATNGHLIRVAADPATAGATPANKAVTDDLTSNPPKLNPMFQDTGDSGAGPGAVPSSANGVLVVNGANGVSAYANQVTIVVDNNRIIEADSNGNAMWAVDSTQKTTVAGGDTPIYNGGAAPAGGNPGQYVTTSLALNRPSSVYELSANDYLVADTGNNRCVRFDRGAKVIWELTKFYQDPSSTATAFLRPGEPDTLNQPTSVQIINATDPSTGYPVVRYLIADSGNFRIVEISDFYDANFQPIPTRQHILTWISHTHDVQGRQYRYGSAAYYAVAYPDTSGTTSTHYFVAALVTNKRIAPVPATNATTGALAPANQDTNGGSIVLLNYDASNTTSTNGYIASATTTLQAGGQTVQIRNPRFLKPYTPNPPTNNSYGNFLLADDNGVFDLALTGLQFNVTWNFIQSQYQSITTPLDAAGAALQALPSAGTVGQFDRSHIPFVPTSIQKLGDNDYLITNGFAQGEAGTSFADYGNNIPPGFGGEVFEVNTGATPFVGGYGGHTLSRPTNTSPLTQPTFAHRVQ